MVITKRQRLKLLNALIYFSENTINAGKVKLFKLLYFLDFIHFEQTGRSVTGMDYSAWPMGPVPESLNDEWARPSPDFGKHLTRHNHELTTKLSRQAVTPKRAFNAHLFTDRESEIMENLAKRYFRANAEDMTEASHFPHGPWHTIYEVEGRHQAKIPYELALQGTDDREVLLNVAKEHEEMNANYG